MNILLIMNALNVIKNASIVKGPHKINVWVVLKGLIYIKNNVFKIVIQIILKMKI
jgi:hypothetical protein